MATDARAVRLYTAVEFGKAERMDRFRIHMTNPEYFKLKPAEEEQFERLKFAFATYREWLSKAEAARVIMATTDWGLKPTRLYMVINNAIDLFGNIVDNNRALEKAMIAERYKTYAKWQESKGDYEGAGKQLERLAKLMLYDKAEAELPPDNSYAPVLFTTDPSVLEEGEEIKNEEVHE